MGWGGCMYGRGACVVDGNGGMHGGDMHGRVVCMAEACVVGGGHVWQEGMCMAGETATAADGTHPTGMHSCYNHVFALTELVLKFDPMV